MTEDARTRLFGAPNANHLWASLVVESLFRNGLDTYCICPGSRSTPLTLAVAGHPEAKSVVHFDERGAAFHALGIAKATGNPVAFICSSGTAVANAYPAVVEASMSDVPLILLTADRPPELQNSGANQTIDQIDFFGGFVRRQFGLWGPAICKDPALTIFTIDRGLRNAQGPVHFNCMMDEPLAPKSDASVKDYAARIPREWLSAEAYCEDSKASLRDKDWESIAEELNAATRGVILVGGLASTREARAVDGLAEALGWPTLPDITSGLRTDACAKSVLHYAVQLLKTKAYSDMLSGTEFFLHLGGPFTSKPVLQFLEGINRPDGGATGYMRVVGHSRSVDPPHRVTRRVMCDIAAFCDGIRERVEGRSGESRVEPLAEASACVGRCLDSVFGPEDPASDISVARIVTGNAPEGGVLYLGNSMPIRDADAYGSAGGSCVRVAANRGASGIDGNIATAAGYARGLGGPVTAVIGDLAALHDLNSLALMRDLPAPLILVIVNNDGGGIFHFLPIAEHPEHFEEFFGTPHGLNFKDIALGFNLTYHRPRSNADFDRTYKAALKEMESCIIEVQTDREENVRLHRRLDAKIAKALASL